MHDKTPAIEAMASTRLRRFPFAPLGGRYAAAESRSYHAIGEETTACEPMS
jgi:hypothetical protein